MRLYPPQGPSISNNSPIIHNKTYSPAIKISDNILALASNKFAVNGEDKLFFLIQIL